MTTAIDCVENIVDKVKLLILSNFTFFHNVFLKLLSSVCENDGIHVYMEERVEELCFAENKNLENVSN